MSEPGTPHLSCPFCGAELTDRIDVDGARFLVFRCMFTPKVDPALSDAELLETLRSAHPGTGEAYFRGMCDRLHGYVTQGEGARILTSSRPER
jgi:hypothetical protein